MVFWDLIPERCSPLEILHFSIIGEQIVIGPECKYHTELQEIFQLLHPTLQSILLHRLSWDSLRAVQEETYRSVVSGADVLVIAPTAGGKTEAALIPVFDTLLKGPMQGVRCIYIAPLKALINDQELRIEIFASECLLTVQKWHGDVPRGQKGWVYGEAPTFLLITPESLEVLLCEPGLIPDLKSLKFIIIDEIHTFAESRRGIHLKALLSRLDNIAGTKVQRIGLSATVGNPREILHWLSGKRQAEVLVNIAPKLRLTNIICKIERDDEKRNILLRRYIKGKKALVFVNSRSDAEKIALFLTNEEERVFIHHSSLSPGLRREAEEAFFSENSACIICTSTLELGIDIGDLELVIQIGTPLSVSSFLQRLGRAGRRGTVPTLIALLKSPCELITTYAILGSAQERKVEPVHPAKYAYDVLVQQALIQVFSTGRRPKKALIEDLRSLEPFSSFSLHVIGKIIENLVNKEYFTSDGEFLMLGPSAEVEYGRSHGLPLFSVIMGGKEFTAITPDGEVVGTLDARFVTGGKKKSCTLGGRKYRLIYADNTHETVMIAPDNKIPGKGRTFWKSEGTGLSALVTQSVARVIANGVPLLPVSEDNNDIITAVREKLPEKVGINRLYLLRNKQGKNKGYIILTFQGRRWNLVLSLLLKKLIKLPFETEFRDFSIRLISDSTDLTENAILEVITYVQSLTSEEIGEFLPGPSAELWKFGAPLPEDLLKEMAIADYYGIEEFGPILKNCEIHIFERQKSLD